MEQAHLQAPQDTLVKLLASLLLHLTMQLKEETFKMHVFFVH